MPKRKNCQNQTIHIQNPKTCLIHSPGYEFNHSTGYSQPLLSPIITKIVEAPPSISVPYPTTAHSSPQRRPRENHRHWSIFLLTKKLILHLGSDRRRKGGAAAPLSYSRGHKGRETHSEFFPRSSERVNNLLSIRIFGECLKERIVS